MRVLVPAVVYEELRVAAAQRAPNAELIPYTEDPEAVVPELESADAVLRWIAGKRHARLVVDGPNVRWLHTASAGIDHVVTPEMRRKPGLVVTNSSQAFGITIAEFVLAWMLMVNRRLPDLLAQQRAHEWKWITMEELHGQTVGIVGLGSIGQEIATRCRAFGMRTLGLRRHPELVPQVDETLTGAAGLERLLVESDWLVLAAALTGETRSMLGAAELARMKPTARLVNIARGAIVDEAALIETLQKGRLAAACLDVFAQEPLPPDSPLWDMPNVYVAPHTSPGWTRGLSERIKERFLANLARAAADRPLEGVVDLEKGY